MYILHQPLPNANVAGFSNASDAVDYARKHPICLAFLDIHLIGANVIFVTAYIEDTYEAWDTGASGFMLKPLTVESIMHQLTKLRHPLALPSQSELEKNA